MKGILLKYVKQDYKTGYMEFFVKVISDDISTNYNKSYSASENASDNLSSASDNYSTEDSKAPKEMFCRGYIIPYPKNTPIIMDGEIDTRKVNSFKVSAAYMDFSKKSDTVNFIRSSYGVRDEVAYDICYHMNYIYPGADLDSDQGMFSTSISKKTAKALRELMELERVFNSLKNIGVGYNLVIKLYNKYGINTVNKILYNPYILMLENSRIESLQECDQLVLKSGCGGGFRTEAVIKFYIRRSRANGNSRILLSDLLNQISEFDKVSVYKYESSPLAQRLAITKETIYKALTRENVFIIEKIENHDDLEKTHNKANTDNDSAISADNGIVENDIIDNSIENIVDNSVEDPGRIRSDIYVWLAEDYLAEKSLAEDILRINGDETVCGKGKSIDWVEEQLLVTYSDDQKEAFAVLDKPGLKIITGPPGSGKTTLLNGLVTKYHADSPNAIITLCAPTGSAAMHMSESTGMEASTIHRLLRITPFETFDVSLTKIDSDIIIVDESSMLDLHLAKKLFSTIKTGAIVILIGDQHQLPAIGPGNVLEDMINSKKIDVYNLTNIHRQKKESGILENSINIVNDNVDNITCYDDFRIEICNNVNDILCILEKAADYYYSNHIDMKVFTPVRNERYDTSVVKLNHMLAKRYKKAAGFKSEKSIIYGETEFFEGEPVIFNCNYYADESNDKNDGDNECYGSYFNGQEGVIETITYKINFTFIRISSNGTFIQIDETRLSDIDPAFARTAHKGQGMECNTAIIIAPKDPGNMLLKRLIYTEITRAKQRVIILSEKDAFYDAVRSKGERRNNALAKRNTGLKERLKGRNDGKVLDDNEIKDIIENLYPKGL